MITVGEVAEQLIKKTPFLEEALAEDLINISSLARKLKPQIEKTLQKEIQHGAIAMAIKRLVPIKHDKIKFGLQQFVNNLGDFIVRSGLLHYTFENSDTITTRQRDLIKHIESEQIYFSVSRGIFETSLVISGSTGSLIDEIFENEKLILKKHQLSSITLRLPKKRKETIGFFYYILKLLALKKINVEELISTTNEFTVLVSDKDIDRAFSILMKLKKE